jgi:hypothetical protein
MERATVGYFLAGSSLDVEVEGVSYLVLPYPPAVDLLDLISRSPVSNDPPYAISRRWFDCTTFTRRQARQAVSRESRPEILSPGKKTRYLPSLAFYV